MDDEPTFGAWLKRRRTQLDLTQKTLAHLASCSVGTIRKMEAGERKPSHQLAGLLARQLEIPGDQHEAFIASARSEPYLSEVAFPVPDIPIEQIPVTPPEETVKKIKHNLPAQPTPFIGREKELAELEMLIADPQTRLVTIVGLGGMGKTRLALAATEGCLGSEQFCDGIWLIDLAPLNDPERVVSATGDSLGLRLQGADDAAVQAQLLDYLEPKKMLLLFDNCEHLLAGMELAADIFHSAPGVQILATSRERLHLRMEQVYPIEGLAFPELETNSDAAGYPAARLFLQSATRNQPDFSLKSRDDRADLARICRLVAGMPLALELAAAWVDVLPLSKIAAGLLEGLDFLAKEMRDMPERHRSVRAAIDHSWGLLGEKECRVFPRLSVFRGGFTRQAAQTVADASLRQLRRLVNKSFLKYDPGSDRYQVHDLMRQYGAEKLADVEPVCTQHLEFFVSFAEEGNAGVTSPEPGIWVKRMLADIDNFRAAMDWAAESGQAQAGLQIGGTLSPYWTVIGDWREGLRRLEQLLALPEAAQNTFARGLALHEAGNLACHLGDYETGLVYLEEGKAIGLELGEDGKQLLGWILLNLAELLANQDPTDCQQLNEQGMALLHELGEPWQFWLGFNNRGWYAVRQGDYDQAYTAFRDGLEFAQKNDHKWLSGISIRGLGHLLYLQGDYRSARTYLEESVAILQPIGDLRHQPLDVLGAVALLEGDPQKAVAYFEKRLEMHRRQGSKVYFCGI